MTGLDHVNQDRVEEAVDWYRRNRQTCARPVVRTLCSMFDLQPKGACEAIGVANRLDREGGTHAR